MFIFLRKYGKIILIYFMVGVWIKMDSINPFNDKCIVNQNDVYLYFEIIRQLKPESVIDIGMFLKRIGAVSRQAMDAEIGTDIELCGVEEMPECSVGVYSVIYDKIWSTVEFLNGNGVTQAKENFDKPDEPAESAESELSEAAEKSYDLAVMLRTDKCLNAYDERRIVSHIAGEAAYLLLDDDGYERNKELLAFKSYRELELEQDRYKIVILK